MTPSMSFRLGVWTVGLQIVFGDVEAGVSVLFVAIPVALVISLLAVVTFVRLVRSGQFDDLETPPRRILFDDAESSRNVVKQD